MTQLGARIFFDVGLSANGSVSCASCHVPERAFADGLAVAVGLRGARGSRNTPSLLNAAAQHRQFAWDGRHSSLQRQVASPLFNPVEHGLASPEELAQRLAGRAGYLDAFGAAFGVRVINAESAYLALAAFVRELASWDSPFDRWQRCGDPSAVTETARRGYALFLGRGGCANCHDSTGSSPTFTDDRYHSVGPGAALSNDLPGLLRRLQTAAPSVSDVETAPLGRFMVTGEPSDVAAFRTPSLRNVALTAPYLHDGSLTTLREVVDWEVDYRGRAGGKPLILTDGEREDLVAFMHTLTSADLDWWARWVRRLAAEGGAAALADKPGRQNRCTTDLRGRPKG